MTRRQRQALLEKIDKEALAREAAAPKGARQKEKSIKERIDQALIDVLE